MNAVILRQTMGVQGDRRGVRIVRLLGLGFLLASSLGIPNPCEKKDSNTSRAQDLCGTYISKMRECYNPSASTASSSSTSGLAGDVKEFSEEDLEKLECLCREWMTKSNFTSAELDEADCELKAGCSELFQTSNESACAEKAGLCLNAPLKLGQTCETASYAECFDQTKSLRDCEDDSQRKECKAEDEALEACEKAQDDGRRERLACAEKESDSKCEDRVSEEIAKGCGYEEEEKEKVSVPTQEDDSATGTTTGGTGTSSGTTTGTTGTSSGSTTTPSDKCGDGKIQATKGEECEGADFGGDTCPSLGFDSGDLKCRYDCRFDTSGCKGCGNGIVESDIGEECEPEKTFTATCSQKGFLGGTLLCGEDCKYDTSSCAGGQLLYTVSGPSDQSNFGEYFWPGADTNGDGKGDIVVLSLKPSHPSGCSTKAEALLSLRSGADGSELSHKCIEPPGDVSYSGTLSSSNVWRAGDTNGDGVADFALLFYYASYSFPASDAGQSCSYYSNPCVSGAKCSYGTGHQCTYPTYCCADTTTFSSSDVLTVYSGKDGSIIKTLRQGEVPIPGTSMGYIGDITADGKSEYAVKYYDTATQAYLIRFVSLATGTIVQSLPWASGDGVFPLPDLNKDGRNDVVVSNAAAQLHATACPGAITSRGLVRVLSGANGSELLVMCGSVDGEGLSYLGASVDGNGDGTPDLLVYSKPKVQLRSGSGGSVVWESTTISSAILGGDRDADGVTDLLSYTSSSTATTVISGKTGGVVGTLELASNSITYMSVADVTGDGKSEILLGAPSNTAGGLTSAGTIFVYSVDTITPPPPPSPTAAYGRLPWHLRPARFVADWLGGLKGWALP